MIKSLQTLKNKKKKGFTLIELIAVMAILAILAAVLAPRVVGYLNDAKKTKILEQARQVVLAVDSYVVKNNLDDDSQEAVAISALPAQLQDDYLDVDKLDKLTVESIDVARCRTITNEGIKVISNDDMTNGKLTK